MSSHSMSSPVAPHCLSNGRSWTRYWGLGGPPFISMCTKRPRGPWSSQLSSTIAAEDWPLQAAWGCSSCSAGLAASVGGVPASSMAGVAASANVELGVSASMPLLMSEGGRKEVEGEVKASIAGLQGLSSPIFAVGLVNSSMLLLLLILFCLKAL